MPLRPRRSGAFNEGERRDLNPRPPGPQPGALPAELRSPRALQCTGGSLLVEAGGPGGPAPARAAPARPGRIDLREELGAFLLCGVNLRADGRDLVVRDIAGPARAAPARPAPARARPACAFQVRAGLRGRAPARP